jgi:hypothetical protein
MPQFTAGRPEEAHLCPQFLKIAIPITEPGSFPGGQPRPPLPPPPPAEDVERGLPLSTVGVTPSMRAEVHTCAHAQTHRYTSACSLTGRCLYLGIVHRTALEGCINPAVALAAGRVCSGTAALLWPNSQLGNLSSCCIDSGSLVAAGWLVATLPGIGMSLPWDGSTLRWD